MGTQNVVDMGPFPSADMIGAVPRGTYGFNLTDTRPDGYYPEDATQRSKDRRFNPKVDERLK